jgi:hypothetical protein
MFEAADKERDNMRADASVLMDMVSQIGYANATPEMMAQLSKFEMQLGYPTGILSAYVKAAQTEAGKVIAHHKVDMADGTEGIGIVTQNPDGSISTQTIGYGGTKVGGTDNSNQAFSDQAIQSAAKVMIDNGLVKAGTTEGDLINLLNKQGIKVTSADAKNLMDTAQL